MYSILFSMRPLTEKQRQLLMFIHGHIRRHGYPPTLREMAEHYGVRSPNAINDRLKALERKGYLKRQGGLKSRAITLTARAVDAGGEEGVVKVPLVGRVAAGEPLLAEQNVEEILSVDVAIFGGGGGDMFALRVQGESMTGRGILDGDIVLVRQTSQARAGDTVVALIDGEATVKTYRPEPDKGRVVLEAANPDYAPIVVEGGEGVDASIIGVVVGLVRTLGGPVGHPPPRGATV